MTKQDTGDGIQDTEAGKRVLNPESGTLDSESCLLDPVALERVRWRCRRGLLELDIVLGRFVKQRYTMLNNEQRIIFDELLDLPDTELWDLITGKKEPALAHQRVVLEWLKEA
jgi:antitoxin CptB